MQTQPDVKSGEILVGAAIMKVGDYGAADAAMVDVGGTDGGVNYTHTKEILEVTVDQVSGPVKIVPMGESMTVKTNLSQANLANLALAMGYPASAVSNGVFNFGGGMTLPEKQVQLFGQGPDGKERKFTFWKCVAVGTVDIAQAKGKPGLIPIELRVLADPSKDEGKRFGKSEDLAADATAPTVASVTPADDAVGVAVGSTIQITFAKDMRAETLTADTIAVVAETGEVVAGAVAYDSAAKRATFTPAGNLTALTQYHIIVTTGVRDLAGNRMAAAFSGKFTTA